MRKPELVDRVAGMAHISKRESDAVIAIIFESITDALARGEDIQLLGFGSFNLRTRAAREGRNPQTGEPLQIKSSQTVAFKPSKALKELVNQ